MRELLYIELSPHPKQIYQKQIYIYPNDPYQKILIFKNLLFARHFTYSPIAPVLQEGEAQRG